MSKTITFGAITLKTDHTKYANLHTCDQKYWAFTCDWSKPQPIEALTNSLEFVNKRLFNIVEAGAFKPENIEYAKQLLEAHIEYAKARLDGKVISKENLADECFLAYQWERLMFRLWYRDTKAAREATEPKAPAKQEKPKAKAQPKAEKPKAKKPAQPKAEIAKANEELFVSKLTKAQKKELLLALMAELLK